ncbi:cytochrome b [Striga asiatica]|uniref:Cytochrome b n=1 Tax=Striga asiatica TaxID=4170 RepID=A0A5A7P3X8_STRAF|nr:cytochrome b [Striga asiatica]
MTLQIEENKRWDTHLCGPYYRSREFSRAVVLLEGNLFFSPRVMFFPTIGPDPNYADELRLNLRLHIAACWDFAVVDIRISCDLWGEFVLAQVRVGLCWGLILQELVSLMGLEKSQHLVKFTQMRWLNKECPLYRMPIHPLPILSIRLLPYPIINLKIPAIRPLIHPPTHLKIHHFLVRSHLFPGWDEYGILQDLTLSGVQSNFMRENVSISNYTANLLTTNSNPTDSKH